MTDVDELVFKEDDVRPEERHVYEADPWKILIVDDETDVHNVTVYMLSGQRYQGRAFHFLHAYSAQEARQLLELHSDVAVVLLDVVMEHDDSGLRLVRVIREEMKNRAVRIVLRTGQPGKAPAARVILEYDIDDYKEKTELTLEKMLVTIIAALRGYSFISTIETNRRGLRKIIEASSEIFERQSLQKLGCGVLSQLAAILHLRNGAMYAQASGLTASGTKGEAVILAATGDFGEYVGKPIASVREELVHASLHQARGRSNGFYCEGGTCAWSSRGRTGSENFLFFETSTELDENDQSLLELFFTNVSLAFDNLFLNKGIEDTQKEIIYHIAETMECRSAETGGHVRRVAEYARLLGVRYGLGEEETEMLKIASTVHDLGKIGIPDAILNKPGPLTPEEYAVIRTHVQRGYDLLKDSSSPIIQVAARIVLLHHERWDGQGYPRGVSGEDIHVHGRIVAVADVFDALSNARVYHEPWNWDQVFAHFVMERGRHFEPRLVDILLEHREEFMEIWQKYHPESWTSPETAPST